MNLCCSSCMRMLNLAVPPLWPWLECDWRGEGVRERERGEGVGEREGGGTREEVGEREGRGRDGECIGNREEREREREWDGRE